MFLPRRSFLRFAAAGAGAILVGPHMALASVPSDRRFVFIIQRGAADGLNIVVPYGDPEYASLRREIAIDPATAAALAQAESGPTALALLLVSPEFQRR